MNCDYLIIGAGIAGLSAATRLRELSNTAQIVLINGEDRLPYKRTKLSKMLYCGWSKDEFAIYPASWYAEKQIELINGSRVQSIDAQQKTVMLDDGRSLTSNKILLAMGCEALALDGSKVFREASQAESFLQSLQNKNELSIAGNGVLAVELAEQASLLGKNVTIYARNSLPLSRDFNRTMSLHLATLLAEHSIKTLPLAQMPENLDLSCIGTRARVMDYLPELSASKNSILVSSNLETSYPDIWAAGDGTIVEDSEACHLWHQAEAQGISAANNMAAPSPAHQIPYLDQAYRLKLEVFGMYYFSMNYQAHTNCACLERKVGSIYQAIYHKNDRVFGLLMYGDKERNKDYEKAVREQWLLSELIERLP